MTNRAPGDSSPRARPVVELWVAVLLAPLSARAVLLVERGAPLAFGDFRGILADLGASALAVSVLVVAGRVSRPLAAGLALVWVAIQFINYETVRFLASMADASDAAYLADPTFFAGSALAVSHPVAMLLAAAITVGGVWRGVLGAGSRVAIAAVASGLALLLANFLAPRSDDLPSWRQRNVAEWNVTRAIRGVFATGSDVPGASVALLDLVPGLAADVSGELRIPRLAERSGARPNVLLVVLESVSGAYLESFAADHGRTVTVSAPELDAIARRNLSFSSFVTHQRKTNRGLYAILCGDLPGLAPGEPKMSTYPETGGRVCLPEILRRSGYATVYHQAAPLAFMLKDRFMARTGFTRINGHEAFPHFYSRSAWGVDDRAYFEQSVALVDELQAGDTPWFLTMLNVGTHHPFIVPEDWQPGPADPLTRAISYLDAAFAAFYTELEKRGVFEDTLLVITSDESFGTPGLFLDPVDRALSQSWGVLIVQTPARDGPLRVTEPYGLLDVATSILDYVGLADRGAHLFGRSVFRSYENPRWMFFANGNLHAMGATDPEGRVLMCVDDFARCQRLGVPRGQIFGSQREPLAWDPEVEIFLRSVAQRSVARRSDTAGQREVPLLADPTYSVDGRGTHVVFGGQYVDLRARDWVEVDLVIDVVGDRGLVQLSHLLKQNRQPPLVRVLHRVRGGQTMRLRYTFRPGRAIAGVNNQLFARIIEGERVELEFVEATFRIRRTGEPPPLGLRTVLAEVVPSPADASQSARESRRSKTPSR